MHVKITEVSQNISLEDGSVTNFVSLRLPNNAVVRAVVTDATLKMLVEIQTGVESEPAPERHDPPIAGGFIMDDEISKENAVIFGGNSSPGEEEQDPVVFPTSAMPAAQDSPVVQPTKKPRVVHTDPQQQAQQYREEQKAIQSRPVVVAPTVPKDDRGYPIVMNGGLDPRSLMGSGSATDEDGVGQV